MAAIISKNGGYQLYKTLLFAQPLPSLLMAVQVRMNS
jgi:hypothetical protein